MISVHFFIEDKPVFSDGTRGLPKTPPYCPFLCNWVFDSFILAVELFAKALWSLETCVLLNNNLCEKLVSSFELSITLKGSKVTSVSFFSRF